MPITSNFNSLGINNSKNVLFFSIKEMLIPQKEKAFCVLEHTQKQSLGLYEWAGLFLQVQKNSSRESLLH